jgi:hypothetical protein
MQSNRLFEVCMACRREVQIPDTLQNLHRADSRSECFHPSPKKHSSYGESRADFGRPSKYSKAATMHLIMVGVSHRFTNVINLIREYERIATKP